MKFQEIAKSNVQFVKKMDLKVLSPVPDLINVEHGRMQEALYTLLDDLIQNFNKSSLGQKCNVMITIFSRTVEFNTVLLFTNHNYFHIYSIFHYG